MGYDTQEEKVSIVACNTDEGFPLLGFLEKVHSASKIATELKEIRGILQDHAEKLEALERHIGECVTGEELAARFSQLMVEYLKGEMEDFY